MQRHCRELGLPLAIAVPAMHLAAARIFDTCAAPLQSAELSEVHERVEALQKAPVMLAIVTVCKHALKALEVEQVRRLLQATDSFHFEFI